MRFVAIVFFAMIVSGCASEGPYSVLHVECFEDQEVMFKASTGVYYDTDGRWVRSIPSSCIVREIGKVDSIYKEG